MPDAPPATRPEPRVLRVPNVRAAKPEDWAQLMRFCAVGLSGYVVNLLVFSSLVKAVGVHHIAAAIGAFAVAWTTNFVMNKHWTFRRHNLSTLQQGGRNLAVSLVAQAIGLVILASLVDLAGWPKITSQAIAVGAVMPLNFLLNRRWSFR